MDLLATVPIQEREFSFNEADFNHIRTLIYQRAGISLHAGKQAMVYSRVARRLRETGHQSFSSYLNWLEKAQGALGEKEWQEFINCLTTNLTAFFREEHHFSMLSEALKKRTSRYPIRIWCSAASTGEEPYSLAITVLEALGNQASVKIMASDIDTNVLTKASRGIYEVDARGLDAHHRQTYFLRGTGANSGLMKIKPELSRLVEFRPFNLMSTEWALGDPFDFIFCRNVMIYFDAATQRRVLERMHKVLKPDGWLFVGHSENFTESRDLFKLRGKTVYERV